MPSLKLLYSNHTKCYFLFSPINRFLLENSKLVHRPFEELHKIVTITFYVPGCNLIILLEANHICRSCLKQPKLFLICVFLSPSSDMKNAVIGNNKQKANLIVLGAVPRYVSAHFQHFQLFFSYFSLRSV